MKKLTLALLFALILAGGIAMFLGNTDVSLSERRQMAQWSDVAGSNLLNGSFMIPANRMGSKTMSLEQLKIVQEAVALIAFVPFSVLVMRQPVSWNYAAASVCIFLAVFFIFCK